MWFQLWDSELTNTTDFVLGSKVAELPSTVHIKLPGLDGIEEQAAKEKEENEASSEALKAREGDADAAARATTKKFRLSIPQHPGPSRILSPPTSSRASSFATDSHDAGAPDLRDSQKHLDAEEGGVTGHSHEDKGKAATKSHKRSQATSSSTSATQAALPRKSVIVEECGGLQAVPVSDKSRQIGGPPADSGQHTRRDGSAVVSTTDRLPPFLICTCLLAHLCRCVSHTLSRSALIFAHSTGHCPHPRTSHGRSNQPTVPYQELLLSGDHLIHLHHISSVHISSNTPQSLLYVSILLQAKWIPRCATIPQTKDTMLKTNVPIYLEQVGQNSHTLIRSPL